MSQSLKIGVSNEMMLGRPAITKAATDLENGRQARHIRASSRKVRNPEKRDQTGENRRWTAAKEGRIGLFVARDRGQSRHVLQQNSTALQIENALFTPLLQLPIDAFARRADEHSELLLRDMNLRTEVLRERA
jgi:hypothetical protein